MAKNEIIKKDAPHDLVIPQEFTIKGKTYSTTLDAKGIHDAGLKQEFDALQKVQTDTATIIADTGMKTFAIDFDRAKALYRVQHTEVYKKDGFENMKSFVESIGLYIGASGLSQTVAAGLVYSDNKAPAKAKNLPIFTLGALSGIINDAKLRAEFYSYCDSEDFPAHFTQADAKEYAAKHGKKAKNGKVKETEVVHEYTAKNDSGETYAPEVEETDSETGISKSVKRETLTADEFKASLEKEYAEVIDLPDKDSRKRILGITADGKPRIFYLSIYSETEAKEREAALKKAQLAEALTAKLKQGKLTMDDILAALG